MDDTNAIEPEYQDEERPEVRGLWVPATLTDVDWALRRMAERQAEIDEIDSQLAQAIADAKKRADKLKAQSAWWVAFFEARTKQWASLNKSQLVQGDKKSRGFIHGRVGFRKTGGLLKVTDKKALEAWLAERPLESGLYRQKLEPEMDALQKYFKTTGEIPDGCMDQPEEDAITVKAELPGTALAKKGQP